MPRALLTLAGGVLVALLVAALLTPGGLVASRGFVWVLLTILAGVVVMGVVVRRAALRQRAHELAQLDEIDDGGSR